MEADSRKLSVWSEVARVAGAIFVGGAGICYVTGLLIVNIRLASYGVISSNLVRTEYMLAGALFIALLLLVSVCMSFSKKLTSIGMGQMRMKKSTGAMLEIVGGVLFPTIAVIIGLMLVSDNELKIWNWRIWTTLASLILASWCASKLIKGVWDLGQVGDLRGPGKSWMLHLLDVTFPVMLCMISICAYARIGYPNLSPAFGGGHREKVVLSPTKEGKELCRRLKLPFTVDSLGVGPVEILTESEDEIVVIMEETGSERYNIGAIRLRRSLCNAVVTLEPKLVIGRYTKHYEEPDSLRWKK